MLGRADRVGGLADLYSVPTLPHSIFKRLRASIKRHVKALNTFTPVFCYLASKAFPIMVMPQSMVATPCAGERASWTCSRPKSLEADAVILRYNKMVVSYGVVEWDASIVEDGGALARCVRRRDPVSPT